MKRWFLLALLFPCALWLISLPAEGLGGNGFWAIRHEGILLSGMVAYGMMSMSMLLAIRPAWLEPWLGGLDRGYRLHKWLGIGAGVLVFTHWMFEILPKSLVQAGWLDRPVRGGARVEQFLGFLHHPAVEVAEVLAYCMIAIVIIALIRLIPYHWFRKLHKVFPVIFLVATFHGIVLMPDALWPTVVGAWTGIWAIVGSIASVIALLGYIGKSRQHHGTVSRVIRYDENIMEIECSLDGNGMHHKTGQFAFLFIDIPGMKDPHPFTITSSQENPKQLRFCVKVLGDDTRRMMTSLQPGARVRVEGPYGAFDFADNRDAQIWVGAGVGIAPFMARLEQMAADENQEPGNIHFFYCAPSDSSLNERIRLLCQQAGVTLHGIDYHRDGNLGLQKIQQYGADLSRASLWFCGPLKFGDMLEKSWAALGLAGKHFHREFFVMR